MVNKMNISVMQTTRNVSLLVACMITMGITSRNATTTATHKPSMMSNLYPSHRKIR